MEIDSTVSFCAEGFFRKCCQLLCQHPWGEVQGHRWRWPPQLGLKWPVNHMQCRTVKRVCVRITIVFTLTALSAQCRLNQPRDYAFFRILDVHWWMFMFTSMAEFACVYQCASAGHPEAARPDVREPGLRGVMSGCLADSADFEQCTQVPPANELSI